ncbi:Asd/ArgC dimerization domain-containing protein, partial [Bacillus cereus group sp. Bce036]
EQVISLLEQTAGIEVFQGQDYPTQVRDSGGKDTVLVGRIRNDISHHSGINLWVVADNVRKGAATNAVQIAEVLIRDYL